MTFVNYIHRRCGEPRRGRVLSAQNRKSRLAWQPQEMVVRSPETAILNVSWRR